MKSYHFFLSLALLFTGLGCQVRESGETFIEPASQPLDWYAHVTPYDGDYAVRLQWSPMVPGTLTRQKRTESGEWITDGTMEVSSVSEEGTFWKSERATEYRFAFKTNTPNVDVSQAPKYLYTKIPEDRVLVDEKETFLQTENPLHLGVATLPQGKWEFTGGKSEVYADNLEIPGQTSISIHNEGKPKLKAFSFRITAEQTSGEVDVEIGPFDPEGLPPVVDLNLGYGGSANFLRKGAQHPKQQIRLRKNDELFYLVEDEMVSIQNYEGLYAAKQIPEKSHGEQFMMVARDGKLYRFGQDYAKKWEVIEDFNFYPALVDFSQYSKVEWSDASIPDVFLNLKEIHDELKTLRAKWRYHAYVGYALTSLYDNLPDKKQLAVLQEMSSRANEIRRLLVLTGNDDVVFNNTPTAVPNVAFFKKRQPLYWLGLGLQGTPKEIVDNYLILLRETRKQFKED